MSDAPETVDYQGGKRQVWGRVHYPEPPAPGTITGRTAFMERTVVLATIDGATLMGIATAADFERAREPQRPDQVGRDQPETRLRLLSLFGRAR